MMSVEILKELSKFLLPFSTFVKLYFQKRLWGLLWKYIRNFGCEKFTGSLEHTNKLMTNVKMFDHVGKLLLLKLCHFGDRREQSLQPNAVGVLEPVLVFCVVRTQLGTSPRDWCVSKRGAKSHTKALPTHDPITSDVYSEPSCVPHRSHKKWWFNYRCWALDGLITINTNHWTFSWHFFV